MSEDKKTITVPGRFKELVCETLDMQGGRADHFVKIFLFQFNSPESWLLRVVEDPDESVIANTLKKFYFNEYRYKYDRQTYRNIE